MNMNIKLLLQKMIEQEASDLFYRAGGIPRLRIDGRVVTAGDQVLSVDDVMKAMEDLTTPKQREIFRKDMDIDFGLYLEDLDRRFRISIFMQRNWPSIVIRNIPNTIATFENLNLPADILKKL